jgi:hypothetical protein
MAGRPGSAPNKRAEVGIKSVGKEGDEEGGEQKKQSCRRTCAVCAYSWIDKYGKPQCPKCLSPMTDDFSFLDTELGQEMQKRMLAVKKKMKDEERQNRYEIFKAKKRGEEKAAVLWTGLKARLLDPAQGGGLSFDERIGIALGQKKAEFRSVSKERIGILRKCEAKGRSRSAKDWKEFKAMLDFSDCVERKCGRCFYTWKDKYGKPDCPKCNGKMMDGVQPKKNENFQLQWWHTMPNKLIP